MKKIILLALVFLFASHCGFSQIAVFPNDSPDPTAIECSDGSGFYAFTTGRGINIFRSTDLINWKRSGRVFQDDVPAWAKEMIPNSRGIWAPDVVFMNGLYHLYYSVSTFGGQRSVIGLAVNKTLNPDSPEYNWENRGIVLESFPDNMAEKTDYNAIDSAVFVDESGKAYLYWGSYWSGIKAVEIDAKTGKPFAYKADTKIPDGYIHIAGKGKNPDTSIEAPYLIRIGDYYFLFVSWGSCCDGVKSTYNIRIGRSKSPLGPFLDKKGKDMAQGGGTLLLESGEKWKGTGHNGVFKSKNGLWLILAAYDAENPKRGRLSQVRPLNLSLTEDHWLETGEILK